MIVRVVEPFIDKYTNKFHKADTDIQLSAERAEELRSLGFVVYDDGEKKQTRKRVKKA